MINPKPLPDRKLLLHLFNYDGRCLFWKNPPVHKSLIGKKAGTKTAKGYLAVKINSRAYKVHRVIFKMKTGREPLEIDHKNRKRDDNVWSNLLASTHVKNQRNRSDTRNPDLPPGVQYNNGAAGHYRVMIWKGKKMVHLGTFRSKARAARTYQEARA